MTSYSNSRETIYPDNARDYNPGLQVFLNLSYETTLSLENIDIQYPGSPFTNTQFNSVSGIFYGIGTLLQAISSSYSTPYTEYGNWSQIHPDAITAGINFNTLS